MISNAYQSLLALGAIHRLGFWSNQSPAVPGTIMQRLTGLSLIAHNQRQSEYRSRADLIRAAGYIRTKANGEKAVAFTAYYEALLLVKDWQSRGLRIAEANNNPSNSAAIRKLIYSIRHQIPYDYRTDSVVKTNANFYRNYNDVDLNIYHQNRLICSVDFKKKIVVIRNNEGRSDKERINRILMHFCGCNLHSKAKMWHISSPYMLDTPVRGYWTEVPFWSTTFPG